MPPSAPARLVGFVPERLGKPRTFEIATPLDGTLILTLTGAPGARFTLAAYSGAKLVARTRAGACTLRMRICGQRSLQIRVRRVSGSGTFMLAVGKP